MFVPLGVPHETPSALIAASYAAAIAEAAQASRVGQLDERVVATLGSARVPGPVRDSVRAYPGANHVVFAVGGGYWRVDVIDAGGSPVPYPVLVHQIHAVMVGSRERRRHREPVPVGAATSLDRDSWCGLREAIRTRSRRNRENLETIESALVLISLDDTDIRSVLQGIDWCWGGQPANRWRDKSLQIMVTSAGRLGLQVEHTTVDGAGIAVLHEFLVPRISAHLGSRPVEPSEAMPTRPTAIEWDVTGELEQRLREAERLARLATSRWNVASLETPPISPSPARGHVLSPDALVQLLLQAAYTSLWGRLPTQYEPVDISHFPFGRTERMHTVSRRTARAAELLRASNGSPPPSLSALLEQCAVAHRRAVERCKRGTWGLRQFDLLAHLAMGGPTPDLDCHGTGEPTESRLDPPSSALFLGDIYVHRYCEVDVSTSSFNHLLLEAFVFPPPTETGTTGVAYQILPESLRLTITSGDAGAADEIAHLIARNSEILRRALSRGAGSRRRETDGG